MLSTRAEFAPSVSAEVRGDQDALYRTLTDHYRGSRDEIESRQSRYLPWIRRAATATGGARVVDVGCGRGEFLRLLLDEGIAGIGVERNATDVGTLREAGIEVVTDDANAFLSAADAGSFAAVTCSAVIEHMPADYAVRFLGLAAERVAPGGCVIIETDNPHCVATHTGVFWTDPTHQRMYTPEMVGFYLSAGGCEDVEVHYFCPAQRALRRGAPSPADYLAYTIVGFRA